MAEKFSVQAVFTAVDHFSGPVSRMSDSMNKLNRGAMGRGGGGSGAGAGGHLARTAAQASAAWGRLDQRFASAKTNMLIAGVAGGYAAKRFITAGAEVESALLAGSSKFGDGIRRNTPVFKELEDAAFSLGKTTRFGAVEAAGALNELAASGFEPAAAMKNLPIIAQMAIAGGEELEYASQIALDSMGTFGMLYDEMGQLRGPDALAANLTRVADVMAYTANQTTASMGSVYETLTDAGAITSVAGMTFEKFAAITGALAQAGIKGSVAGTAIKNITVRLLSPTSEGSKELKNLKIEEKSFRKMTDPLQQLEVISEAIMKLPKEDQIKALDEYFGKIPLAAASYLAKTGFRNARELESKIIANSTGANQRQSDIVGDSTLTKMSILENRLSELGKHLFDKIQAPLESGLTRAVNFLESKQDVIGKGAVDSINWVSNNGEQIGDAIKFGAYAFAGAQGAKLLVSGAKLTKDLYTMGAGAVMAASTVGKATAKFVGRFGGTRASSTALLMGQRVPQASLMARMGLGAAGGLWGGAATVGLAATQWQNEEFKASNEMGALDFLSKWQDNLLFGGSLDPAKIIDEHKNKLARDRKKELDIQNERFNDQTTKIVGGSPMDTMMAADHMARIQEFLRKPESLEPVKIPEAVMLQKMQPINVQPIIDAIAMQIASNPPTLTSAGTATEGLREDLNVNNSNTVDINVQAEKGTQARARARNSAHTRVNNHRNGIN